MNIALIPARGGSKRIPRKNIKLFKGKPLLSYAINAAKTADLFDDIIVSTDDAEIAEISSRCGASVPFMRPQELADDYTGTMAVVAHAAEELMRQKKIIDFICCIYPTTPLLLANSIQTGFTQLVNNPTLDYVFGVCEFDYPIQRGLTLAGNGKLKMLFPEHVSTRSQDFPVAFHDAGQFYWGRVKAFLNAEPMFGEKSLPLFLPRERAVDIDTQEDWRIAEVFHDVLHLQSAESADDP